MHTIWCDGRRETSQDARMNDSGEGRQEATGRKTEVLSAKAKYRTGLWNARTMHETGNSVQLRTEMKFYCLHILGDSESGWTRSCWYRTNTGERVLHSGRDNDQHYEGIDIILKKGLEMSLVEWKSINSSLMKITMKVKRINTIVIQCHAPTYDSEKRIRTRYVNSCKASCREY